MAANAACVTSSARSKLGQSRRRSCQARAPPRFEIGAANVLMGGAAFDILYHKMIPN